MVTMAYDVTLEIDGVASVVTLDTTYPAANSWDSAVEFAINMAIHDHPGPNIEVLDCAADVHAEYTNYGYIHDAPMVLQ